MKIKNKKNTVQKWIGINKILENGIIKLENGDYIKIIKVKPINYSFKSEFEKESILNAYKAFLKICNFDIQILIQSKKEDLKNNIKLIRDKINEEKNEKINEIREKYIENLLEINLKKESISKDFFIIIKKKIPDENNEEIVKEELKDKFIKIKECLKRCGNEVEENNNLKNKEIIYSFFNTRKFLRNNKEEI